ncbi:MAG: zf-TFIIB domain-containing protein [Gemmatimonadota bacterium]
MNPFTHRLPHQPWPKPSRNEEEYFHLEEFRQRMSLARRREAQRQAEERRRLQERYQDRCPRCGVELEAMETEGARADQCPNCLGVWLDHETFDRLTGRETRNDVLTSMFRDMLLQYTTGRIHPAEEKKEDEKAHPQ